jgi:hypothetical protein
VWGIVTVHLGWGGIRMSVLSDQVRRDRAEVDRAVREFWSLVDKKELDKRRARVMSIQLILREVGNG